MFRFEKGEENGEKGYQGRGHTPVNDNSVFPGRRHGEEPAVSAEAKLHAGRKLTWNQHISCSSNGCVVWRRKALDEWAAQAPGP